jgi:hypothetical protein
MPFPADDWAACQRAYGSHTEDPVSDDEDCAWSTTAHIRAVALVVDIKCFSAADRGGGVDQVVGRDIARVGASALLSADAKSSSFTERFIVIGVHRNSTRTHVAEHCICIMTSYVCLEILNYVSQILLHCEQRGCILHRI